MVMNALNAVSAYKKSGTLMDSAGPSSVSQTAGGEDFGKMVKGFLGEAVDSLHEGEKAATAAATGKADIAQVVTAIDNAELVLTEITTIRDKVISAYQTITSGAI
ncbi:MAG: flagellar hook-basal body complex protein FliE [Alphaproteobacteria bacterium]|nr:flagellar hook-basal body complex protein FliE [Alphaproteobacteria bacterium]